MPTKYFYDDPNVETACDDTLPHDFVKTIGTPGTHSGGTQSTTYVTFASYALDVSGDSPITGVHNNSIDVTIADAASEVDYRITTVIKNSGCTVNASDNSPAFTGTGIKTDTTASLTWSSDTHLGIRVQARKLGNHGNKGITWNHNDIDSFIEAPWGAGSNTTINCDQGSFALSGQTTDTLWKRLLEALQGSFVSTGQTADLKLGFLIEALQGSFNHSGQSAGMLWGHLLEALQGSFVQAGQDTILFRNIPIVAGLGSFNLSGQDAILSRAVSLAAGQGSFSQNGQDATPLWDHLIEALQGSFVQSGQETTFKLGFLIDVELKKGSILIATQGSYSLDGQDSDLERGHNLSANKGLFALVEQDANLFVTSPALMVAEFASFTLNGLDASLLYATIVSPAVQEGQAIGNLNTTNTYRLTDFSVYNMEDVNTYLLVAVGLPEKWKTNDALPLAGGSNLKKVSGSVKPSTIKGSAK